MIYILYLVVIIAGAPLVLQSPHRYETKEKCEAEGKEFTVKTPLPIQDAGVYCEAKKIKNASVTE